jgi:hypothetical protein
LHRIGALRLLYGVLFQAKEKPKALESKANDREIQAMCQNLDAVYALAESAAAQNQPARNE